LLPVRRLPRLDPSFRIKTRIEEGAHLV
jgi:hypothetical protein